MRSPSEVSARRRPGARRRALLALLASLGATGCGDWSNEDLRFFAALPTHDELAVVVPAGAAAPLAGAGGRQAALATCGPLGAAETWLWAKPTSDRLNASIDFVLGLVDVVRRYPPTTRLDDGRIWGPFPDDHHPGNELRIVILRSWPDGPEAPPQHAYTFEARLAAAGGPFRPILSGLFVGPSATRGTGALTLDFEAIRELGMADPDAPRGEMRVQYARDLEPRTVRLSLASSAGFGLAQFDYAFTGYADGRGRLDYAFVNADGDRAEVSAGFDAAGAGRAETTFFPIRFPRLTASYQQCWSAAACLVWSDDVNGYSCGGGACAGGVESDCPVVPAP